MKSPGQNRLQTITSTLGITLLGVLSLASCNKDFLEIDPKATQVKSTYYKNETEAFRGLIAAYDPLGWEGKDNYGSFVSLVAGSDEAYSGGGSSSDLWYLQTTNNYALLDPANGPQADFWDKGFTGIARVNTILSKLKNDIPGLTDEKKNRYIAEAKFLRAYYYFDLVRLFRNVPLFTVPIETEDIYNVVQADPADVYAFIEQDLKDAIAEVNLPDIVSSEKEGGRVTKGAAHALLGKVLLYQKKWREAATQFAVVNGTPGESSRFGYKLLVDFSSVFRPDNKFSSESVFEISHTSTAASGWGNTSLVEGFIASTMVGPRTYVGTTYYSGWGGCPITPGLYNLLHHDPRFDATIIDLDSLVNAGVASYVPGYLNTGYFIRKYAPLQEFKYNGTSPVNLNYPQNYIEIRLADTYLMEAEALVKGGGDLDRAGALLNAVRSRVNLGPVIPTLENIYKERRLELATEGHRWYDLVRTGQAATVLSSKGFIAGKNEIFPIPLKELSNTKLKQNPNY